MCGFGVASKTKLDTFYVTAVLSLLLSYEANQNNQIDLTMRQNTTLNKLQLAVKHSLRPLMTCAGKFKTIS